MLSPLGRLSLNGSHLCFLAFLLFWVLQATSSQLQDDSLFICAKSGTHIPMELVCDDESDCGLGDNSDEEDCPDKFEPVKCDNLTEFACSDLRNCIKAQFVCDGVTDCFDNSDELHCNITKCREEGHFECTSGDCIDKHYRCDGAEDCPDKSDERNCPSWSRDIIVNCEVLEMFLCKDKSRCLPLFKVCDTVNDCHDKSDEGGQCNSNIEGCAHSDCGDRLCTIIPSGPFCFCGNGSLYNTTTKRCEDIDECSSDRFCDQICINTPGSFECKCHEGYAFDKDHVCRAQESEAVLVYSSGRTIYLDFLVTNVGSKSSIGEVAAALTYSGNHLYWATVNETQAIYRSNEFGSNIEPIVISGISLVEDLVVDWITQNLYFTDFDHKHIAVCSNDGISCTPLISNLVNPRALALYSTKGLLFFSTWGDSSKARIAKAGMDGSHVTNLVTDSIQFPNGIALDMTSERLYWADAFYSTIESVDLNGSQRRTTAENVGYPYSLDIFENRAFWSDWSTNGIEACHKLDGKDRQTITRKKRPVYAVHVYHPILLKGHEANPCQFAPCKHLCILAPITEKNHERYKCACPSNMYLAEDMKTCLYLSKPSYLIAASDSLVYFISYQPFGKFETKYIQWDFMLSIGAIAYNGVTGEIILSDLHEGLIIAYNPNTNHKRTLHSAKGSVIVSIDIDPIGYNLYWADETTKTVQLLNLHTLINIVLIRDLGNEVPLDIVLIPSEGLLFVALYANHRMHIDRFTMDGDQKSRQHIFEYTASLSGTTSLTYDYQLDKLYWSELESGSINSIEKDGSGKNVYIETSSSLSDLTVVDDALFWVNIGSNQIHWMTHNGNKSKEMTLDKISTGSKIRISKGRPTPHDKTHVCLFSNGNCSHICIPVGKEKICACPDDQNLDKSGFNCVRLINCRDDEFTCSNGQCIPFESRCNTLYDCPDGEDEQECKVNCQSTQFACHDGQKCIDSHQRCDGTNDCHDGSDELYDCNKFGECSPGEFRCTSGHCIHAGLRCDAVYNCEDESDEENCEHFNCDPNKQFKCKNGPCIPKAWECDGDVNCEDSSDEHSNCSLTKQCHSDNFKCKNGRCIHKDLKCNHEDDCEDMSDEADCHFKEDEIKHDAKCGSSEYVCRSDHLICLPASARCNGTVECPRGEDEKECKECIHFQFKCETSGKCIPNEWVCDRINDCGDNSDEQHCPETHFEHDSNDCDGYKCRSSGTCIPWNQVCDNKTDCADSSDEGGSCDTSCINASCNQKCLKSPNGHKCSCRTGYKLHGNGIDCVDINECLLSFCSQRCINTVGSFRCSCDDSEYTLKSDKISCKALEHEMEYVFATSREIRSRSDQVTSLLKLTPDVQKINGIDVDMNSRAVFITSEAKGQLMKRNLELKSYQTINNLKRPSKLSYDWSTGYVYFVEKGNTIQVCDFNSTLCAQIYSAGKDATIDALRIDSVDRSMFWSESQSVVLRERKSTIFKANLAGKNATVLVSNNVKQVGDIALDGINNIMYWSDSQAKRVEQINYNGNNRLLLFANIGSEPLDLNLFEDHIYWLNGKVSEELEKKYHEEKTFVTKCGLFGHSYKECSTVKLMPSNSHILGFRILHPALQKQTANICSFIPCSYMCINGKTAPFCICSDGSMVNSEQKCSSPPSDKMFVNHLNVEHVTSSNSSLHWIWWTLLILPLCALLSWIAVSRAPYVLRKFKSNSSGIPSVHFHNPRYDPFDQPDASFFEETSNPGEYERFNNKSIPWHYRFFNNRDMKISRGLAIWPFVSKDIKLSEKLIEDNPCPIKR